MTDIVVMAWCYLKHHRFKTLVLVFSIMLIVYLPAGLNVLGKKSAQQLTIRAEQTPLLVGAKGSPLELVLNSLYFESDTPPPMRFDQSIRVADSKLAKAIPLYTRFRVRQQPIVGTTLDYFEFRQLQMATGRPMALLGECVLGALAAKELGAGQGDSVLSSPENVFDLAGVYPLKMKVTGVLSLSGTPDDRAVFCDIKTAWIIEGLAHGHQDLSDPAAASGVLQKEGNTIIGNASVVQYNEITAENVSSFHFHGEISTFPVTAVLAIPHDEKSATLLQGRYLSDEERVQLVQPAGVMQDLLATVFTVQHYVIAVLIIVGLSTLATAVLVFMLSLQLRSREIETMHRIGGAKKRVYAILAVEIAVVLLVGVFLAIGLTALTSWYGPGLIQQLLT